MKILGIIFYIIASIWISGEAYEKWGWNDGVKNGAIIGFIYLLLFAILGILIFRG